MAELTPEMIAAGIFLDSSGIPTLPDGTPALAQNRVDANGMSLDNPPQSDGGAGVLAHIAHMAGLSGEDTTPYVPQIVGGFEYPQDPLGYGFGPYYSASEADYPDNRTPLDPEWNWGEEGGKWEDYYTPHDQSTGGGFFLAEDVFGGKSGLNSMGRVPIGFQQGATRPSTNNWRLFEGGHPRMVMRNGYIINLDATNLRGPGPVDGGWVNRLRDTGPNWSMDPTAGFPASYSYGPQGLSFGGWPGNDEWASFGFGNQG